MIKSVESYRENMPMISGIGPGKTILGDCEGYHYLLTPLLYSAIKAINNDFHSFLTY